MTRPADAEMNDSQRQLCQDLNATTPEQIAAAKALHDTLVPIFGRVILRLTEEAAERKQAA